MPTQLKILNVLTCMYISNNLKSCQVYGVLLSPLAIVICAEWSFSQAPATARDFPQAFSFALNHYVQSGTFASIMEAIETTFGGNMNQDIKSATKKLKEIIKANCQCMLPVFFNSHKLYNVFTCLTAFRATHYCIRLKLIDV